MQPAHGVEAVKTRFLLNTIDISSLLDASFSSDQSCDVKLHRSASKPGHYWNWGPNFFLSADSCAWSADHLIDNAYTRTQLHMYGSGLLVIRTKTKEDIVNALSTLTVINLAYTTATLALGYQGSLDGKLTLYEFV